MLVYTNTFTRLTRLVATKDKQATTVASAILRWIYTYGVPQRIHSDQGKEFCNEMMQIICRELDVDHTTTSPYHSQCNAAVERFNRTMKTGSSTSDLSCCPIIPA